MKFLALLVFAGVSVSAIASFDLMMIPKLGGGIQRYDPVTKVQLGTFGGSQFLRHSVLDGSSLWTYPGTFFQKWNYSTGELESSITNGFTSTSDFMLSPLVPGRMMLVAGTVGARTLNSLNPVSMATTIHFALTPNINYYRVAPLLVNGFIVAIGSNSTNNIVVETWNLSTGTQVSQLILSNTLVEQVIGQPVVIDANGTHRLVFFHRSATGQVAESMSLTGGTSLSSSISIVNFSTTWSLTANHSVNLVRGHSSYFAVGSDFTDSTQTRVVQFALGSPLLQLDSSTINMQVGTGNWSVTNVVAPEPGTWMALGAGLVAILRRRKSA